MPSQNSLAGTTSGAGSSPALPLEPTAWIINAMAARLQKFPLLFMSIA
jgi:hypothetical protein